MTSIYDDIAGMSGNVLIDKKRVNMRIYKEAYISLE